MLFMFAAVGCADIEGHQANAKGSESMPGEGDLVITELMALPIGCAGSDGEYFEVYNPTNRSFALNGLAVLINPTDDEGTVVSDHMVEPGQYAVIAMPGDKCESTTFPVHGTIKGTQGFVNHRDHHLTLSNGKEVIDETPMFRTAASKISWTYGGPLDSKNNDDLNHWYLSECHINYGLDSDAHGIDYGSPGEPYNTCFNDQIPTCDLTWGGTSTSTVTYKGTAVGNDGQSWEAALTLFSLPDSCLVSGVECTEVDLDAELTVGDYVLNDEVTAGFSHRTRYAEIEANGLVDLNLALSSDGREFRGAVDGYSGIDDAWVAAGLPDDGILQVTLSVDPLICEW